MLVKLLLLAGAGGLGTLARYGLSNLVTRMAGGAFPWSTLVVNLLGSFLFGLIVGFAEHRISLSEQTEVMLLAGFMGAFTTFSTFAFHTGLFLHEGQWAYALGNIAAQNVLGVSALLLGLYLARPA